MENTCKIYNPDLKFDEKTHTYWLESKKDVKFTSATTFISKFFAPFNAPVIAKNLVDNHPKYRNYTVAQLLREWQQTGTHGTKVHNEIEKYILGDIQKEDITEKKAEYGVEYLDKALGLEKFQLFPEMKVASVKYQISGMIDLLAYDPDTDRYIILDWKQTRK